MLRLILNQVINMKNSNSTIYLFVSKEIHNGIIKFKIKMTTRRNDNRYIADYFVDEENHIPLALPTCYELLQVAIKKNEP